MREGMHDTLTLMRLRITGKLAGPLCSTNLCESMIEIVRHAQRSVKRWQDGDMRKRWTVSSPSSSDGSSATATSPNSSSPSSATPPSPPNGPRPPRDRRARYRLTIDPRGSPPKFHDPDILERLNMTTDPTPENAEPDLEDLVLFVLAFLGILAGLWLVFWLTSRTGTQYEVLSLRIHGTILTVAAIVVTAYASFFGCYILLGSTVFAIAGSFLADSVAEVAQAVAAVVWLILYLIWIFSFTYYLLGSQQHWNRALSHVDAIYVAVGTLTTAGSAGISASGDLTRSVLIGQMVLGLLGVTVSLALVLHRVMQAARPESTTEPVSPPQERASVFLSRRGG
jgi:hypothetical protein